MKRIFSKGLIFAGILGIAAAPADTEVTKTRRKFDLRETLLRTFLKNNHCPDQDFTELFLSEADAHGLDWRLLPSLALVESGGGRTARNNNLFGWAQGAMAFGSIGEAIHNVASALAVGRSYRGKDLNGKLAAYNQRIDYPAMVLSIMSQISPRQYLQSAE